MRHSLSVLVLCLALTGCATLNTEKSILLTTTSVTTSSRVSIEGVMQYYVFIADGMYPTNKETYLYIQECVENNKIPVDIYAITNKKGYINRIIHK